MGWHDAVRSAGFRLSPGSIVTQDALLLSYAVVELGGGDGGWNRTNIFPILALGG